MAKTLGFSAVAVAVSLAGCNPFGDADFVGGDGGGGDDSGTERSCFGTGVLEVCIPEAPTMVVPLPSDIDTDMSPLCSDNVTAPDGSELNKYCVVQGTTIRDNATVKVVGSKPLVLIATNTIEIGTTLDLASNREPEHIAAGTDPDSGCDAGMGPAPGSHGGGAGGSLGGLGGRGGGVVTPTAGGTSGVIQSPITLRGGCRGQTGSTGSPGIGGHGGGAVYLIARTAIRIMPGASINASGGGGSGGINGDAGGGGGGSGGMIGLDAPMLQNDGKVFANGASGGEGSANADVGNSGPEPQDERASAATMSANPRGGEGGGGGAAGALDGRPGTSGLDSGGGGGGGAGFILTYGTRAGDGAYSPAPLP